MFELIVLIMRVDDAFYLAPWRICDWFKSHFFATMSLSRHENSLSSTRTKFISLLHRSCLLHLIGSPEKVVVKGAIMSHCEKVLLTNGAINSFD